MVYYFDDNKMLVMFDVHSSYQYLSLCLYIEYVLFFCSCFVTQFFLMLRSSSEENLPTLYVSLFNGASVNVSLVIFKSGVFSTSLESDEFMN